MKTTIIKLLLGLNITLITWNLYCTYSNKELTNISNYLINMVNNKHKLIVKQNKAICKCREIIQGDSLKTLIYR